MKRLTAWLIARRRRNWVNRLQSAHYRRAMAALETEWLEGELRKFDEAHAPAWSPLVEFRGGELVRMPDGTLARVAPPAKGNPLYSSLPRSRRELYGHDAAVESAIAHERTPRAWPLALWVLGVPAIAVALLYLMGVL